MLSAEMKGALAGILAQDIGKGDVTSALVSPKKCSAAVSANQGCVAAGIEEACFLFESKGVKAKPLAKDGSIVKEGRKVISLEGENRKILWVERTALNILGRMSAVASACAEAKRIAGGNAAVALTRKTIPGFNLFDKKAAVIAGIWPHRTNLNSFVLLKDNHLVFFNSPSDAVLAARKKYGRKMEIEVEAESLQEAISAAKAKPGIIMLDNFLPGEAGEAVQKLRRVFRGKIELSGGIGLHNLALFAAAKPDIVSMGCLTQAVASCNFGLHIRK